MNNGVKAPRHWNDVAKLCKFESTIEVALAKYFYEMGITECNDIAKHQDMLCHMIDEKDMDIVFLLSKFIIETGKVPEKFKGSQHELSARQTIKEAKKDL